MVDLIRPKDLPAATDVFSTSVIPVDDGANVEKATPKQIVDAGRPVATQQQAIDGVDNDVAMTPLTTIQSMQADSAGVKSDAEAARDAAQTAQGLSEGARDSAQGYASSAGGHASNAAGSASDALRDANAAAQSESNAAGSENTASQAAIDSGAFRDLAQDWAESPTAPGDPGTKSSKTWAIEAGQSASSILSLTASATTLAPGASATATYNAGTGNMAIGVPEGLKGDPGTPGVGVGSVPTSRIIGRKAAGTGPAEYLTPAEGRTLLGLLGVGEAGQLGLFLLDTAPDGWIVGEGADISRALFPKLFSAFGTRFGAGDGSTTFGTPDLRGEFFRGLDGGRGVDGGRVLGSYQADEFKSHSHKLTTLRGGNDGVYQGGPYGTIVPNAPTSSEGGAETRPRNIALLACIKY